MLNEISVKLTLLGKLLTYLPLTLIVFFFGGGGEYKGPSNFFKFFFHRPLNERVAEITQSFKIKNSTNKIFLRCFEGLY